MYFVGPYCIKMYFKRIFYLRHAACYKNHSDKINLLFVWRRSRSMCNFIAVDLPAQNISISVSKQDLAFEETGDKSKDIPLTVSGIPPARSIQQKGDKSKIFSYVMWCEDTKLSTNLKRHCVRLSETATSYCYDWLNVWLERNRETRVAYKLFGMNAEGTVISSSRRTLQFNTQLHTKILAACFNTTALIKAPYQQTFDTINKQVTINTNYWQY